MRIVSTTLSGNAESTIGDALRSVVDYVDACIVIDTGITDGTLDVARAVCGDNVADGGKLIVHTWEWRNDFGAARNEAAHWASQYGYWQIFVDTDERLHGLEGLREKLEKASEEFFMVSDTTHSYVRERIFRLPIEGRWHGPTHEAYIDGGAHSVIADVTCEELPKTDEQLTQKFLRDIALLRDYTRPGQPGHDDPRWYYYLGDGLAYLKEYDQAIKAFFTCADMSAWDEQAAWSCYRAAVCFAEKQDYVSARNACVKGLTFHAGVAELAWYAGWCSDRLGQSKNAVGWANMAIANGLAKGDGARFGRIGFRFPAALYEAPFDLLRWNLPPGPEQVQADRDWVEAYKARKTA